MTAGKSILLFLVDGRVEWKAQGEGSAYGSWQSETVDHALEVQINE